jgi:hypothetical protein
MDHHPLINIKKEKHAINLSDRMLFFKHYQNITFFVTILPSGMV